MEETEASLHDTILDVLNSITMIYFILFYFWNIICGIVLMWVQVVDQLSRVLLYLYILWCSFWSMPTIYWNEIMNRVTEITFSEFNCCKIWVRLHSIRWEVWRLKYWMYMYLDQILILLFNIMYLEKMLILVVSVITGLSGKVERGT